MRASEEAIYDLTGRWVGLYGPHGEETVEIATREGTLVATKVTGDPHVPAGQVTFEATLHWRRGTGRGRIAEKGFADPRWVPGALEVVDRDHFLFHWLGVGSVAFVRA